MSNDDENIAEFNIIAKSCLARILFDPYHSYNFIWADTQEIDTNCISEQLKLRLACAYPQSRQSLPFSMYKTKNETSSPAEYMYVRMGFCAYAISTKIAYAGSYKNNFLC